MTDRIKSFIVVLEHDVREDDVESLVQAIRHLRGVLDIKLNVAGMEDWDVEQRTRLKIRKKILEALEDK